jgi:hypothetical protein
MTIATLFGCAKQAVPEIDFNRIEQALASARLISPPPPQSETEQAAITRFISFYADYTADTIQSEVEELYETDAFFADPYHLVEGIDQIKTYFIAMAEPALSCHFEVGDVQRAGDDYYCRWTMHLISRAAPNETIRAQGLTHMRINETGKIIFHQDYWDTSALLDRLPVVGFWTRLVKQRILGGLTHE